MTESVERARFTLSETEPTAAVLHAYGPVKLAFEETSDSSTCGSMSLRLPDDHHDHALWIGPLNGGWQSRDHAISDLWLLCTQETPVAVAKAAGLSPSEM